MRLLVTGRSGTGKTTVCGELQKMGLPAFDGDHIEGLSGWVDLSTHPPVSVDYSRPIDERWVGRLWDEKVMHEFLTEHENLILCGSADNQLEFYPLFGKVILLSLPADEQIRRIHSRKEHSYGKAPGMAEWIVAEQARLLGISRDIGVTIMNANRPPRAIAIDIIRHMQ